MDRAMKYSLLSRAAFSVAGISARVSNDRPQAIGALWQQFYAQGIAAKISNKKSENIYSVYFDYESDHTKPYTMVIGCEVSEARSLPEGLVSTTVPAATYAVIAANGKQPDSVNAAWQWVYGSDLARTYSGDFDLYVSSGPDAADLDVSLHVAVADKD
jgi:predicted transcriptional regulator YdeE